MKLWKVLAPITICLLLILVLLPTQANAATEGYYTYTVYGGKATITECDSSVSGDITIPSTLGGYPVTTIGGSAFYFCDSLTSVTIGDSVTTIGDSAFYYCSSLTSVTIPDSVTTIGKDAFCSCASLTSVIIPNSVTVIGSNAFGGNDIGGQYIACGSLTGIWVDADNPNYCSDSKGVLLNKEKTVLIQAPGAISGSYVIPNGVITIGDYAFLSCASLTSVTIPDSVTTIGICAFNSCFGLTSVTIPSSVTRIGGGAFSWCSRLTGIWVDANNPNYSSDSEGVLLNKEKTSLIQAPGAIGDKYAIPTGVITIDGGAFQYCGLTSVMIPSSVTRIGGGAFFFCVPLHDVWYTGNQADRQKISIGPDNYITSAIWHYDACSIGVPHTYDNACDTICNVCGHIRTITHKYQWIVDQKETCGAAGVKHEECTVCHVKRSEGTRIPATNDHRYDNACDTDCNVCGKSRTITHIYQWVTDLAATCGTDGIKHEECTVCHVKRSEGTRIPATNDHRYDNACDATCNICSFERTVPEHSYTLNGNHTCDICKYSKMPSKPVVESKINSSVTLVKTEGFEYSKDGKSWQASNVFTSLAPATTYTFYQRVKASSVAQVSENSEGVSVTFKSAQAAPSAPIITSFTDTTLTLIPITGGEYSVDGKTWQTDSVFYDLTPGTKYTVYQRYAETDTHEASNASAGTTVTMDKSDQLQIPSAPTVKSTTSGSITLNTVDGCEYSKDGKTWQKSNTFSGLNCGTEYTFYQRYAESATHYAGKASQSVTAKTDKGNQSKPPVPELDSKTHNTVTLVAVDGCEYSRDSINWQKSNVFTGLNPKTNYFFYQRKAETATHYASEASASLIVKTNEEPDYTPGDVDGTEEVTTDDAVYLLLHVMFGESYYPAPDGMSMDFDGNGSVTTDDAVYLLLHVMFGETYYPLKA